MVHNSSTCAPLPPRNSVAEALGSATWSGMPLAIPISSQGGLPLGLQPPLPSSASAAQSASNNANSSLVRQRQPRPPPPQQSRPSTVSTNSLSVGRNVERVLEDCAHTGRLNLSGRGMKDLVYPSCNKYNLIDTITADISRNRLNEFPSSLLDLVFLERLDCRENLIKSVPDDIVRLRCLVHLDLSRNLITALPAVICKLPALEILLISHNRLTSLPQEIGSLVSLMELDASSNQLNHLPTSLSRLSRLRALDLRKNQLQALPNDFADLRLVQLDISQNRFSALPTNLRSMSTLECLQIGDNPLEYPPVQVCNRGQIHIFKCLERSGNKSGAYLNGEQRRQGRSEDSSRDRREVSNRSVEREHGGYASPASLIPVPVPFNKHVILHRESGGSALNGLAQRKLQTLGSSLDQPAPERPIHSVTAGPQRALSLELPSLTTHDAVNNNRNGTEAAAPDRGLSMADADQNETRSEAPLELPVGPTERLLAVQPDLASLVMVDADGSPEETAAAVPEGPLELSGTKRPVETAVSTKADELNSNGIVHRKAPVAASQIPRKISPGQTGANGRSSGKSPAKGAVGSGRPRTGSGSGSASGAASTSSSQSSHALSTQRDALVHSEPKGARGKESEAKSSSPAATPHAQSSPLPDKDSPTPRSEQTSARTKLPLAKSARGVTKQKSVGQSQAGSDSSAAVSSAGARKTSWPPGSTSATMPPAAGGSNKVHGITGNANDYNPNFTIRRQQEQIREEGEKLEVLRKYLENRLKLRLPEDLLSALQDGVILCHLVNHIRPRSVISIHVPSQAQTASGTAGALPKLTPAKCRRNVENFLDACRRLGLSEVILCAPTDILEGRNVSRIVDCVQGLNLLEGSVGKRSVQVASSFSLVYSSSAVPGGAPGQNVSAAGKRPAPATKGAPADQQPATTLNGGTAGPRVGSGGTGAAKKNSVTPGATSASPGFSLV